MGFFNKYPYTNEHELNLDWIIAKINALKDRVKGVEDAIHDIVVETPNDGKLTIKRNNTIVGDFTANQATDEDINISVPENTSDLNNDSDFITSSDLPDMSNYYDKTETDTLLADKADVSDLPDMDNYYNKTETDTLLADKADVSDLPDMTDYYDKTETDALLADKADISSLATVATTGDYDDLINTPTIPAAQVNSDWNANSGVAEILNKPTLAAVATSGNYNDLNNKPTINNVNILSDTFTITGTPGAWTNHQVTFTQPFTTTPLVNVYNTYHNRTNNWGLPCIDNITNSGFRISWWDRTGTEDFIWQAIGY